MPNKDLSEGQGVERPLISYPIKATISQVTGTAADTFDAFVITTLAPILSKVFFPPTIPPLVSTVLVLLGYGITAIIRPLGGALFGNLADKFGRRNLMIASILGIGLVSSATGLLPTYAQVGYVALVSFYIIRGAIGLFVGGEYAAGFTFNMEWLKPKYRGLASGLINVGFGLGITFSGVATSAFSHYFGPQRFAVFGWRYVFFSTLIPMVVALFVRLSLIESPMFSRLISEGKTMKAPFRQLFKRPHVYTLLQVIILMIGAFNLNNASTGFLTVILTRAPSTLSFTEASQVYSIAGLGAITGGFVFAIVSQLFGRRRIGILAGLIALVLIIPLLYFMLHFASLGNVNLASITAFFIEFLSNGPFGITVPYVPERFRTAYRASGVGFGYNGGYIVGAWYSYYVLAIHSLFRGLEGSNVWLSAGFIASTGAAVMAIAFAAGPETSKIDFEQEFQQNPSRNSS